MNLKDVFYLSINGINKFKAFIFVSVISLFGVLLFFLFTGTLSFQNSINGFINNNLRSKTIGVHIYHDNREDKKIIKEIESLNLSNISKIFDSQTSMNTYVEVQGGYLDKETFNLYGLYDGVTYTLEKGEEIKNENEIVCPSEFSSSFAGDITSNQLINLNDLIGKNFKINYFQHIKKKGIEKSEIFKTYEKELKLVGTYNVDEINSVDHNLCYVSSSTLDEIIYNQQFIFEDETENKLENRSSITILFNSYQDIDKNLKILLKSGFDAYAGDELDLSFFNAVCYFIKILSIVLAFIAVILVYFFIKNTLKENKKNIALYKIIGYKDKIIEKIFTLQYIITVLISCFLSIILIFILKYIAELIISKYPLYKILIIKISFIEGLLYFIIVIISVIVLVKLFLKQEKDKPVLKMIEGIK